MAIGLGRKGEKGICCGRITYIERDTWQGLEVGGCGSHSFTLCQCILHPCFLPRTVLTGLKNLDHSFWNMPFYLEFLYFLLASCLMSQCWPLRFAFMAFCVVSLEISCWYRVLNADSLDIHIWGIPCSEKKDQPLKIRYLKRGTRVTLISWNHLIVFIMAFWLLWWQEEELE